MVRSPTDRESKSFLKAWIAVEAKNKGRPDAYNQWGRVIESTLGVTLLEVNAVGSATLRSDREFDQALENVMIHSASYEFPRTH